MSIVDMSMAELLGAFVGLVLTLGVFSYIFGDNVLFRLAIHIFIGVAAGYAAVLVWYNVILYQLVTPLVFGGQAERFLLLFPLILGVLLLAKASPRISALGNPAMAYLVGVGAAAAVGGAVLGTILPQVSASANSLSINLFRGFVILVGTVTTLIYFHFGARERPGRGTQRPAWMEGIALVGQGFIAITFGALFAGVYAASLAALIERLNFIVMFVQAIISP